MILVLGATGMFGGRIACGLLEAGRPRRAPVHNRDNGADLEAAGAELAVADLDGPEPLAPTLEGIEQGGADLEADTVRELTGREPITVEDRVQQHLDAFRAPVG